MHRYQQVEAKLDRSVRYSKKDVAGNETTIEQAWFNGAGDLIKVATDHTGPGTRELTEYFAPDFTAYGAMFVLTRKESAQPDGTTQVDESRQYIGSEGKLIRELKKSARFKPGESMDTVHTPNVVVDLKKQPKDNRSDAERSKAAYEFSEKPQKIASSLQEAGPPESDPLASVTGDSEKYRVIRGTTSPDEVYAIALGFTKEKIDWEKLADTDFPGTYSAGDYDGDDSPGDSEFGKNVNYVVDLTTRRILGPTGCGFFGTRRRYNHRECEVFWSPDSKTFVELTSDKWNYVSCHAGRIAAGPKLVGNVDLGKYAEKSASTFLGKHKSDKYQGSSVAISSVAVADDGAIDLTILGQESGGERKGDIDYSVDERIRLRETPSGLRLEAVSARKSPDE
jgi:hypothetical protein